MPDTKPVDPTPVDNPDDTETNETDNTTDTTPNVEELNPVVIPDGWEAVPENEGGGMRPKTVPWVGYEGA